MSLYSSPSKKYIAFKLAIPTEYYCKVNDILNELMNRFNMSEGDIKSLGYLIDTKNNEFIKNFPDSLGNNFFEDLINKRDNGLKAVKVFIEDTLENLNHKKGS